MTGIHPSRVLRIVVVASCCAVAVTSGCAYEDDRDITMPVFSADGSLIAYGVANGKLRFLPAANLFKEVVESDVAIHWWPVDRPEDGRHVPVAAKPVMHDTVWVRGRLFLAFSPDSKHLAVWIKKRLFVIDIASGEQRPVTPRGEVISSFAWRGNDEIAYAAHTWITGLRKDVSDRTFWRTRIDSPASQRKLIRRDKAVITNVSRAVAFYRNRATLEQWSPNGRYVIYLDMELGYKKQTVGGRLRLLDADTGVTTVFGRTGRSSEFSYYTVAWKADSSAALSFRELREVAGRKIEFPDRFYETIVVHPATGKMQDLTEDFNRSFSRGIRLRPHPQWTLEGSHLIVNTEGNGYLASLDPWQLDPVGRRLAPRGGGKFGSTLHPLPVPGRLWGWDSDGRPCILDYNGRRLSRFDIPTGAARVEYVLGPKGRRIALVTPEGVTVRPLAPPITPSDE